MTHSPTRSPAPKAHYSAPGAAFAFTTASLTELAREAGSDTIVTAHAPIGPARSRLDALEPELREAGLRLVRVLRPLDRAAWPHAIRGGSFRSGRRYRS